MGLPKHRLCACTSFSARFRVMRTKTEWHLPDVTNDEGLNHGSICSVWARTKVKGQRSGSITSSYRTMRGKIRVPQGRWPSASSTLCCNRCRYTCLLGVGSIVGSIMLCNILYCTSKPSACLQKVRECRLPSKPCFPSPIYIKAPWTYIHK